MEGASTSPREITSLFFFLFFLFSFVYHVLLFLTRKVFSSWLISTSAHLAWLKLILIYPSTKLFLPDSQKFWVLSQKQVTMAATAKVLPTFQR